MALSSRFIYIFNLDSGGVLSRLALIEIIQNVARNHHMYLSARFFLFFVFPAATNPPYVCKMH